MPHNRQFTWFNRWLKLVSYPVDSEAWASSILTLTSTRAMGYASKAKVQAEVLDAMEFLSTPRPEDKIVLNDAILSKVADVARKGAHTQNLSDAAAIMIANSGSLENPSTEGGKFPFIRKMMLHPMIFQYNLNTGEKTMNTVSRPADKVFHGSIDYCMTYPDKVKEVNVLGIQELGGKVRVPTMGHTARTEVLQPLGKILMESLKHDPRVKEGLTMSRQAWLATKRFDKPPYEKLVALICSDLKRSTDGAGQGPARQLVLAACDAIGVPYWYARYCVDLWLTELRMVYYPSKFEDPITRIRRTGALMGDPITKVFLALSAIYASEYLWSKGIDHRMHNTGDDYLVVVYGLTKAQASLMVRVAITQTGMIVSELDHFPANPWGHYTEFGVRLPGNRWEVFDLQMHRWKAFPCFADYVRPRSVMRQPTYSFKTDDPRYGRLRMLAQEGAYVRTTDVKYKLQYNLASVIQDVCLNFGIEAYIPLCFGGGGKHPPPGLIESYPDSRAKWLLMALPSILRDKSAVESLLQDTRYLHRSHLGEHTYIDIKEMSRLVEADPRLKPYEILSRREMERSGCYINTRVLDNPYVCTSADVAEKIAVYGNLISELFPRLRMIPQIQAEQPKLEIPDWVYKYPMSDAFDYKALSLLREKYGVAHTIYDKKVLEIFNLAELRRPNIPLSAGVAAGAELAPQVEYEFYHRLLACKDQPAGFVQLPRENLDDDSLAEMVSHHPQIRQDLAVLTNDFRLLTQQLPWGVVGRDLISIYERGVDVPDTTHVFLDMGNFSGYEAGFFDGIPCTKRQMALLGRYFFGNYAPFYERTPPKYDASMGNYLDVITARRDRVFERLAQHMRQ